MPTGCERDSLPPEGRGRRAPDREITLSDPAPASVLPSNQEARVPPDLADALGLNPGESPFPWQSALLQRFLEGRVPRALDIPTGLGKTATIAIWLLARAAGAPVPRRLVYVVDRRA